MNKLFCVLLISGFMIVPTVGRAADQSEDAEKNVKRLSELWRKGTTPDVRLEEDEKKELEKLLLIVLPSQKSIGADKEWKVRFADMDANDFFVVELEQKGEDADKRYMWFHILYKLERPEFYGSEKFGKYTGMGAEDVHFFILVGNVEIRAVADADEYRSDDMIKGTLKAFKLTEIEKL